MKIFNWNVIKSIKDKNDNMNDNKTMKLIPINKNLVICLALGEILIIVRPQQGKKIKKKENPNSAKIPFS